MKIIPIAADSLGTRSMATFVETGDCNICIDPAVSLGPRRYGLPPHPLEYKKREEHWENIKKYAEESDVLILTHYHYDHHDPEFPEMYRDKAVFIKHPIENINRSQKGRAELFLKRIDGMPGKLEYADSREFSFGDTRIRFSNAVFHGTGNRLGYVVETCIREGDESFVFTSDVEGPNTKEQTDFIIKENPNVVYLDGPLSYMLGYRYSYESLAGAVENILSILNGTDVEKLVVDHHLLRDLNWKEKIARVFDAGKEVLTAAEFLGIGNNQLEARRKELFKEHPVRESTLERWGVEE